MSPLQRCRRCRQRHIEHDMVAGVIACADGQPFAPFNVYVDAAVHPFGRMMMCHMFSPDPEALHLMADQIRVPRKWFQNPATMPKVSWPHYDICKSKRALALTCGAVEVTKYQMVVMAAVIQGKPDPLRLFRPREDSDYFAEERPRLEAWLAAEGFPCAS